jgi:hypothetical protein
MSSAHQAHMAEFREVLQKIIEVEENSDRQPNALNIAEAKHHLSEVSDFSFAKHTRAWIADTWNLPSHAMRRDIAAVKLGLR